MRGMVLTERFVIMKRTLNKEEFAMTKMKSRNGKIDFLRFFFSVIVVLNHAKYFTPKGALQDVFKGYSLAVEFFFLVSGYLMMATIERAESRESSLSLARESGAFLFRKFKSVYPEIAIAYIAASICVSLVAVRPFLDVVTDSWTDLFLISSTGLRMETVNGVTWYISSMLICMAILYPLLRKYKSMMVRIVLPLLVLLVLGYMKQNLGSPRNPTEWLGFTFRGNMRAFAEIGLGVLCYFAAKKVKQIQFKMLGKILLTAVEVSIYISYVWYMSTTPVSMRDYLHLFLLCVAVIISFSAQGVGANLFNNRFFAFLGKYSLSLYLGHVFFASYLHELFPFLTAWRYRYQLLFYLFAAFATAAVVFLISNLLRKYGNRILTFGKRLFTVSNSDTVAAAIENR